MQYNIHITKPHSSLPNTNFIIADRTDKSHFQFHWNIILCCKYIVHIYSSHCSHPDILLTYIYNTYRAICVCVCDVHILYIVFFDSLFFLSIVLCFEWATFMSIEYTDVYLFVDVTSLSMRMLFLLRTYIWYLQFYEPLPALLLPLLSHNCQYEHVSALQTI